eukprot:TRINITY_DN4087_c0_g1_i1.p1 TRINITY_DN4087_c0_g1~~TRINITY_DN4087_c0_g1_i1.p1  ORF type:complete len:1006 (+),score=331.57 TRINITY_DN4087_c0_g1_i1:143-3160(+)
MKTKMRLNGRGNELAVLIERAGLTHEQCVTDGSSQTLSLDLENFMLNALKKFSREKSSKNNGSSAEISDRNMRPRQLDDNMDLNSMKNTIHYAFMQDFRREFEEKKDFNRILLQFFGILRDFREKKSDQAQTFAKIREILRGREELNEKFLDLSVDRFDKFLENGEKSKKSGENGLKEELGEIVVNLEDTTKFVALLRAKTSKNPEIFNRFLEILRNFKNEKNNQKETFEAVQFLLNPRYKDLFRGFQYFLPASLASTLGFKPNFREKKRKMELEREKKQKRRNVVELMAKGEKNGSDDFQFFARLRRKLNDDKIYFEVVNTMGLYSKGIISRTEMCCLLQELLKNQPDFFEWFIRFIRVRRTEGNQTKRFSESKGDTKNYKRCGPSYRTLPRNKRVSTEFGRTELPTSVLNDKYISVPHENDEGVFKHTRKNIYQEASFQTEDERYHIDLTIECNLTAIKYLVELQEKEKYQSEQFNESYRINGPMDEIVLGAIKKVYAENADRIIDSLMENPHKVIPIVLNRLQQKNIEWSTYRREMNKIWRSETEYNHLKDFELQAINFKQVDKRNLIPQVLVAEIREKYAISLKNAANKVKDSEPQMAFKMEDSVILDTIYSLALCYTQKNSTKEEEDAVKLFFEKYVREFFSALKNQRKRENSSTIEDKSKDNMVIDEASRNSMDSDISLPLLSLPDFEMRPLFREEEGRSEEKYDGLFYGNKNFYVAFRLIQVLYSRLEEAKQMAKSAINTEFASLVGAEEDPLVMEPKNRYLYFLKNLFHFVSNVKETSSYEKKCTQLLGSRSYRLFTLNSVMIQLVKQIISIVNDPLDNQYLTLFSRFENEDKYYAAACEALANGESFFKFDYYCDTSVLSINISADTKKLPSHISQTVRNSAEKHKEWTEYVNRFVSSEAPVVPKKHDIFLSRNLRSEEETNEEKMIQQNGLQCRISLDYKLFWLEDTEDYLYRPNSLSQARENNQRPDRLGEAIYYLRRMNGWAGKVPVEPRVIV